jgi:hypothetical protein
MTSETNSNSSFWRTHDVTETFTAAEGKIGSKNSGFAEVGKWYRVYYFLRAPFENDDSVYVNMKFFIDEATGREYFEDIYRDQYELIVAEGGKWLLKIPPYGMDKEYRLENVDVKQTFKNGKLKETFNLDQNIQNSSELIGKKYTVPRISVNETLKITGSDWFWAHLMSALHLIDKYQSLVATLLPVVKKPLSDHVYRVAVCSKHLYVVERRLHSSYAKEFLPSPIHFYHRAGYLPSLFKVMWKYVVGSKGNDAWLNLDIIITPNIKTDEQLFSAFKARDEGYNTGFDLKKLKSVDQIWDKNLKKGRSMIPDWVIGFMGTTRDSFLVSDDLTAVPANEERREAQRAAWKQARLLIRLFIETILEVNKPEMIAASLQVRDNLFVATEEFATLLSALPRNPKVGSYTSSDIEYAWKKTPEIPKGYEFDPKLDQELDDFLNKLTGEPDANTESDDFPRYSEAPKPVVGGGGGQEKPKY